MSVYNVVKGNCHGGICVAYDDDYMRQRDQNLMKTVQEYNQKVRDNEWMTAGQYEDAEFIKKMSYVPDYQTIDLLRMISSGALEYTTTLSTDKKGQQIVEENENMPFVRTKNKNLWFKVCDKAPWFGQKYHPVVGDKEKSPLTFIQDYGKYPMHVNDGNVVSMGLNGILAKFDERYGKKRFNLFQGSRQDVHKLLNDFLRFRDENEISVLSETYKHMNKMNKENFNGVVYSDEEYHEATQMLQITHGLLAQESNQSKKLRDVGLGLVSFCQTWDKKNFKTGGHEANFSVPSPHFQTRVVVRDGLKLYKFLHKNEVEYESIRSWFKSYARISKKMTEAFLFGYEKKFVHLDGLRDDPKMFFATMLLS